MALRDTLSALQALSARPLVLRELPLRDGTNVTGYVDLVSERAYGFKGHGEAALAQLPESVLPEEHEARRYDKALARYEGAATKSKVTLSMLNIGQGAIIAAGLTLVMIQAAKGVADGSMTLGDFVLVNSYLIQLYMPLNFLGFVYREIKQSLTDMESMFRLLRENAEIEDSAHARPLELTGGEVRFDDVYFGNSAGFWKAHFYRHFSCFFI